MDTSTTRIEGLDINTHYIVQVSATNGAGTSDISPPVGIVAPEGTSYGAVHPMSILCLLLQSLQVSMVQLVLGTSVVMAIALLVVTALILIIMTLLLKRRKNEVYVQMLHSSIVVN
jgi:hypothetical protein